MDYPNGYDVSAFPAGKYVAVARFMGIGICVLFAVALILSVLLVWSAKSSKIDPFLISINKDTSEWSIVGHSHGETDFSVDYIMQTSLVWNYFKGWFTLSDDERENQAMWRSCDRTKDCIENDTSIYTSKDCYLYCNSSDSVFKDFTSKVRPVYEKSENQAETLSIKTNSIRITPYGSISSTGGLWKVQANIESNISGDIKIIAFIRVERNIKLYPKNFGFYVSNFNSYRL